VTLRYQPGDAEGLPNGFAGGARVTASGPIVGVANNPALGQGGGDWLLTSEGFPAEPWIAGDLIRGLDRLAVGPRS
jgi:hypothetical protein